MSYDALTNIRKLRAQEETGRISDAARLANELQTKEGMGRTEALKEAFRLQVLYGQGLTLSRADADADVEPEPDPDLDPHLDRYPCRHSRFTQCRRCRPVILPDIGPRS